MASYATTPGIGGVAARTWPEGTTLIPVERGATMLMFLHARCPCSKASIAALRTLMEDRPGTVARVLIYTPNDPEPEWTDNSLWSDVRAIKGVAAVADPCGAQAAVFGVRTSGDVLVYDERRILIFEGGITPGRGETGTCAGLMAVGDALDHRSVMTPATPVYGCELFDPSNCPMCREVAP